MKDKYQNMILLMPDVHTNRRLPIVCVAIKDLHHNLVVALLSDLFGIQTRGGVSCTGLLVDHIKNLYNIAGWVRITFNWLMTKEEIDHIIDSIEFLIQHGIEYKKYYAFDETTNLFNFKK
jgi:selenocysteine lyase/cysteine desulfurase